MPDTQTRPVADDSQLITAALDGDVAAFDSLVCRYWNMVVAIAMTRISGQTDAEDVAQETFIKAHRRLSTLRDHTRFAGWLARIAHQNCTDVLRRTMRRTNALGVAQTADNLDALPAPAGNPGLSKSQMLFIRRAVMKLPEKFRNLIVMRFVTGLTAPQIAHQLGKRPGTVRVWLHRAYKILRTELTPLFEEVES